ncbi:MAG: adenylosuccinate lyase [Candidatus Thermoplasmatota archaeon]
MEKAVCPLDFRYGYKEMKDVFSEENRHILHLKIEAELARAHASLGNIPKKNADEIVEKIFDAKLERVKEIEKETKHDIMAMVKACTEACGESGKYIHLGATSNDIIDTANALQISQAIKILRNDCIELIKSLLKIAKAHKKTIMLGRTHGQAALPITFGLKIAVYIMEMLRHIERLDEVEKRICVSKMMGAVGTGAGFGNNAMKIQETVMSKLNLGIELAPTQIVQRDRYVEFVCCLANIAGSIEKFATEIRNLQRTEIGEVAEAFEKKQVGSSTMPHKKNPVVCENICGLARVIRSFVIPTFENVPLWHERDLTNSSSERFIIPHVCILTDYILRNIRNVFENLVIYHEKMRKNLELVNEEIMSEAIMLALVKKGFGRQEAHEMIRKLMLKGLKKEKLKKFFSEKEIEEISDPYNYLGCCFEIVDRVIKEASQILSNNPQNL